MTQDRHRDPTFSCEHPLGCQHCPHRHENSIRRGDLDSVAAGELTNWTLGVNGYLEDHVRIMANLVDGSLSVPGAADTDVSGAQLRLQWDF